MLQYALKNRNFPISEPQDAAGLMERRGRQVGGQLLRQAISLQKKELQRCPALCDD
jgi:hypothetical protein